MWAAGQTLGTRHAALETPMAPGEERRGLAGLKAGDGAGLSTTFSCNAQISILVFILAGGSVFSPPLCLLHPPETCPRGRLEWQRALEVADVGCQEQRRTCTPALLEASREGSWEDRKAQAAQCQLGVGVLSGVWGSG